MSMNKNRRAQVAQVIALVDKAIDLLEDVRDQAQYVFDNMPVGFQSLEHGEKMVEALVTIGEMHYLLEHVSNNLAEINEVEVAIEVEPG
jgi:hypothetical protein